MSVRPAEIARGKRVRVGERLAARLPWLDRRAASQAACRYRSMNVRSFLRVVVIVIVFFVFVSWCDEVVGSLVVILVG